MRHTLQITTHTADFLFLKWTPSCSVQIGTDQHMLINNGVNSLLLFYSITALGAYYGSWFTC